MRFNAPFHPDDTERAYSGYFASVNRNKKSIAVDLKTEEGRDIVIKLCRDADAVVDSKLRVHGVRGLRVTDASVMPSIVSGATNAAAIMIGGRAAGFIRADIK